jgi:hypothetical protein
LELERPESNPSTGRPTRDSAREAAGAAGLVEAASVREVCGWNDGVESLLMVVMAANLAI